MPDFIEHEEDILLEYIRTARDSALPPRVLLFVVVLMSIVSFFSCWNSRPSAWPTARIRAIRSACEILDSNRPVSDIPVDDLQKYIAIRETTGMVTQEEKENLREILRTLETARTETIRIVRIPFLGVTFDINDLGLFSGIAFVLGLTMFRYSLHRELQNIQLAFGKAEQLDRNNPDHPCFHQAHCFDLMSMGQVAQVPPSRATTGATPAHWRHATKVGLFLPILVQCYLLINDLSTYRQGMAMSTNATLFVLIGSTASLLLIAVLTYSAGGVWIAIEKEWRTKWNELSMAGHGIVRCTRVQQVELRPGPPQDDAIRTPSKPPI